MGTTHQMFAKLVIFFAIVATASAAYSSAYASGYSSAAAVVCHDKNKAVTPCTCFGGKSPMPSEEEEAKRSAEMEKKDDYDLYDWVPGKCEDQVITQSNPLINCGTGSALHFEYLALAYGNMLGLTNAEGTQFKNGAAVTATKGTKSQEYEGVQACETLFTATVPASMLYKAQTNARYLNGCHGFDQPELRNWKVGRYKCDIGSQENIPGKMPGNSWYAGPTTMYNDAMKKVKDANPKFAALDATAIKETFGRPKFYAKGYKGISGVPRGAGLSAFALVAGAVAAVVAVLH